MNHAHARKWDLRFRFQYARIINHHVSNMVSERCPVVTNGMQLTSIRIQLRVGSESATHFHIIIHTCQLVIELDRQSAGFNDGQSSSRVLNDTGVRRLTGAASDVSIPVPHCPPCIETNTMHHAPSDKPVIPTTASIVVRVRAVTDETAGEFVRNNPCDIKRGHRRLGKNRGKITFEIAIGRTRKTTRQPETRYR